MTAAGYMRLHARGGFATPVDLHVVRQLAPFAGGPSAAVGGGGRAGGVAEVPAGGVRRRSGGQPRLGALRRARLRVPGVPPRRPCSRPQLRLRRTSTAPVSILPSSDCSAAVRCRTGCGQLITLQICRGWEWSDHDVAPPVQSGTTAPRLGLDCSSVKIAAVPP